MIQNFVYQIIFLQICLLVLLGGLLFLRVQLLLLLLSYKKMLEYFILILKVFRVESLDL